MIEPYLENKLDTKNDKSFFLLAINKPKGIICTHNDERNRKRRV